MAVVVEKSVTVPWSPAEVFRLWTTEEGVRSFLAPEARVELRLWGRYEILFDPDQPPGLQGTEGMRVMGFLEDEWLSVEWNAPPSFPALRAGAPTCVVVQCEPAHGGGTRVRLRHAGFSPAAVEAGLPAYFEQAWTMVMAWLSHRCRVGPVDWAAPPRSPAGP